MLSFSNGAKQKRSKTASIKYVNFSFDFPRFQSVFYLVKLVSCLIRNLEGKSSELFFKLSISRHLGQVFGSGGFSHENVNQSAVNNGV